MMKKKQIFSLIFTLFLGITQIQAKKKESEKTEAKSETNCAEKKNCTIPSMIQKIKNFFVGLWNSFIKNIKEMTKSIEKKWNDMHANIKNAALHHQSIESKNKKIAEEGDKDAVKKAEKIKEAAQNIQDKIHKDIKKAEKNMEDQRKKIDSLNESINKDKKAEMAQSKALTTAQ